MATKNSKAHPNRYSSILLLYIQHLISSRTQFRFSTFATITKDSIYVAFAKSKLQTLQKFSTANERRWSADEASSCQTLLPSTSHRANVICCYCCCCQVAKIYIHRLRLLLEVVAFITARLLNN